MTTSTADLTDAAGQTLLARCRAAVDGWEHVDGQRRAVALSVASYLADDLRPDTIAGAVATSHAARIATGATLDLDQLRVDLDTADEAARRQHLQRAALVQLRDDLTTRGARLLAAGVDNGLAVAREHVAALLDDARAVLAELGDVETADDAINARRTEQWATARALAEQLDHARDVQRVLVSDALPGPNRPAPGGWQISAEADGLVDQAGHDSNAPRVLASQIQARPAGGWQISERPDEKPAPPWTTGSALDRIRYATSSPTTWVPTLGDLRATAAEVRSCIADAHALAIEQEARPYQRDDMAPSAASLRHARRLA